MVDVMNICASVLEIQPEREKFHIICAFNFSINFLQTRHLLTTYFKSVLQVLLLLPYADGCCLLYCHRI